MNCDEDIRTAIQNLPKDLVETYIRILERIRTDQHTTIARQIFQWMAIAKRPMTLSELQEAIAIEPYTPHSKPERIMNDMYRVISWCEGLVTLDEQNNEIQFTHPSVRELLMKIAKSDTTIDFGLNIRDAEAEVGTICVTYLNFNDFKTQIVKRNKLQDIPMDEILKASISSGLSKRLAEAFVKMSSRTKTQRTSEQVTMQQMSRHNMIAANSGLRNWHAAYPFMSYASHYWLLHTADVQPDDRIWNAWKRLLLEENSLANLPWTCQEWNSRGTTIADWITSYRHCAVLTLVEQSECKFSVAKRSRILINAASYGICSIVDRLLAAKAEVNVAARLNGRTAKAEVNAAAALQAAAGGGHLEVVDKLLAAKAEVNAAAGYDGRTALQAAAGGGHLEVVVDRLLQHRLLAAKAEVNAAAALFDGRTALQAAAGGGHLEVVDKLLAAKAEVNAAEGGHRLQQKEAVGRALQAAAGGGHLEVVDRLLAAKAEVNAAAAERGGRTALQAAAGGGHLEVVDRLLAAKAEVNAAAGII